jgi:hypothetical protein
LCWLYATDDKYNRLWGGPGTSRQTPLPCAHLGAPTGEHIDCRTCAKHVSLKVFACAVHGRCVRGKSAQAEGATAEVPGCQGCKDYERDTFKLVAPVGTADVPCQWMGRALGKPWGPRVTVAVPHLNTLDVLRACLDLVRLQTEQPYIVVIDTGSSPAVCRELERLRSDEIEVHFIRAHGYLHSSAPVTTALDLAHALCRSEWLLHTHADVFFRRRDLIAWLREQCGPASPVVGWEMSPRAGTELWRGTVSHTCTLLHMPAIRRIGATWSLERYYDAEGYPAHPTVGWPDTESGFALCLRAAGMRPKLLGAEPNYQLHRARAEYLGDERDWFDHARSLTGLRAYAPGSPLHQSAEDYAAVALAEARERAGRWLAERPTGGPAP